MKKNRVNNNTFRKMTVIILAVIFALANFCSCAKRYPITVYDKDLTKSETDAIVAKYESIEASKEEAKQKRLEEIEDSEDEFLSDETKKAVVSSSDKIDDEYLQYEQEPYIPSEVPTNFPVTYLFRNQPDFKLKDYTLETFENYSDI